jgi:hypothetical protein
VGFFRSTGDGERKPIAKPPAKLRPDPVFVIDDQDAAYGGLDIGNRSVVR